MRENEFEKQVQQKMDEFQLEPSASVWQKVEEEIRKKKRRRIIFFFILPGVLLLAALSAYYFARNESEHTPSQLQASKQVLKPVNDNRDAGNGRLDQQRRENPDRTPTDTTEISPNKTVSTPVKNNPLPNETRSDSELITSPNRTFTAHQGKRDDAELQMEESIPAKQKSQARKSDDHKTLRPRQDKTEESIVIASEAPSRQGKTADNKTEPKLTETKPVEETPGDLLTAQKEQPVKEDKNEKKDSSITAAPLSKDEAGKKMIVNNTRRLKWGFDLGLGTSGISRSLLSLEMQKSADNLYYNSPGSVTGGSSGQRIILAPSPVKAGWSMRIGIVAEKQFSPRSRISGGLAYNYASTKINIGGKQDSSISLYYNNNLAANVDAFYRGQQSHQYTNRYHFIQVPITYHWQVTRPGKLPLEWKMGLNLGYLVSTNGLLYDTSFGGIYYRKKDAFTGFHVNLATGLSLRFKSANKAEWVIGPEVSFGLDKLFSNPLDRKQYLLFGGINARFFLPQKKK
jgi:hypothetical protein